MWNAVATGAAVVGPAAGVVAPFTGPLAPVVGGVALAAGAITAIDSAYDAYQVCSGAEKGSCAGEIAMGAIGTIVGVAGANAVRVGFAARRAARSVPEGVVYGRTDFLGGKPYVGQASSEARYSARQSEHARANPNADFDFDIIGRANPGIELDRMEEFFIRRGGGPTNLGNPNGGLANKRHQMSDSRYADAGGDLW